MEVHFKYSTVFCTTQVISTFCKRLTSNSRKFGNILRLLILLIFPNYGHGLVTQLYHDRMDHTFVYFTYFYFAVFLPFFVTVGTECDVYFLHHESWITRFHSGDLEVYYLGYNTV